MYRKIMAEGKIKANGSALPPPVFRILGKFQLKQKRIKINQFVDIRIQFRKIYLSLKIICFFILY